MGDIAPKIAFLKKEGIALKFKAGKSPYCDDCGDCEEKGCNYHELTGFSHDDVEGEVETIETIEER